MSIHLSIMHPRLLSALALLEPMIQRESPTGKSGPMFARGSSRKPDIWKSRREAETVLRASPWLRAWDRRAIEKYLRYGLRSLPTALHPMVPGASDSSVTLTTTKAQEAWTFLRMNVSPETDRSDPTNRFTSPDLNHGAGEEDCNNPSWIMTAAAPGMAFELLPYLRPPVLYVFGENSQINSAERRQDKLNRTGIGLGGSGGARLGRVKAANVAHSSHMMPMEKINETARLLAGWMETANAEFKQEQEFYRTYDSGKSTQDQTNLSQRWMQMMNEPAGAKRPKKSYL
jgi:pimeloyl-ACP methyl ester carboxylesterase